jgi:hypothetical protein
MDNNKFREASTPFRRQRGISVSHEDLRSRVGVVTPCVPEVFVYSLTPR